MNYLSFGVLHFTNTPYKNICPAALYPCDLLSHTFNPQNYPDPSSANTSSSTDYTQVGYDENGNVTVMRTRKGTAITHTYDNLNRLTARTYPNAADNLVFSYDLRGLKTASQYANGSNTVTYNWDNAGRLLTTSSAGRTLSYTYDLASNRTQTTWPDTTFSTTGILSLFNHFIDLAVAQLSAVLQLWLALLQLSQHH